MCHSGSVQFSCAVCGHFAEENRWESGECTKENEFRLCSSCRCGESVDPVTHLGLEGTSNMGRDL